MAALAFIRAGDTLVVWRLDRLAHSIGQLIETVELLERQQIGFQPYTENIDTTNPNGRLVFHLFAALAEFERGVIRERTVAGLAAARERGRTGGRRRSITEKDLVAAKAMLKDTSITINEVARRLKTSPATLYRYLPGGRSALDEQAASQ